MQLVRLATIRLQRPPPLAMGRWLYVASNGVEVVTEEIAGLDQDLTDQANISPEPGLRVAFPFETAEVRLSVKAVVDAGPPEVSGGLLEVPEEPRRRAEGALSEYADVLGVGYQCRRVIRSPQPCVAMAASGPGEISLLQGVSVLKQPSGRRTGARVMPPVVPAALLNYLRDRLDGVALLAGSLAEDSAVGRCRNLMLLYERAFKKATEELIAPLTTFLRSNPRQDALQYKEDEVRYWIKDIRPHTMHADARKRVASNPDIEPYLARMEMAAYDVLFNKEYWRKPSSRRINRQVFMSAVGPAGTTIILHQGATLHLEWIDPFGVYPIDHPVRVGLPEEWIWCFPGQQDKPPSGSD